MGLVSCTIANCLWFLSTLPEAWRFRRGLADCAASQAAVLGEILRANAQTQFGRRHGFAAIHSPEAYQAAVPLTDYEACAPAIDRIAAGEGQVLTAGPVMLLEPTSGSTAAAKLIPYTRQLKEQFQRGIAPWIADLYRHIPALLIGESYWSVTPAARQATRTSGGIPVGFEDDSEYLGGLKGWLVRSTQAVPAPVKRISHMASFWYVTALFLLRSRRLALISVWNPTFLTILCDHLWRWWPQLADDLAAGTITPPVPLEEGLARQLAADLRPDPDRAAQIRAACSGTPDRAAAHRNIWPHLRLLSCWTDGAAAHVVGQLHALFPEVTLQGKGLIATECFATLPLLGRDGCLPALRSHFFEFLPEHGGAPRLLHQLTVGATYSLVVTTGGGLYRYRLHDLVRVTGRHRGVPLFRFLGKGDGVVDRFGEKLNEEHVRQALLQATEETGLGPAFAMLAFDGGPPPAYVLYLEAADADDGQLRRTGALVEERLRDNFHYAYCRDLGQLAALRVFRIAGQAGEAYLEGCVAQGQRLGDVKPRALHRQSGWTERFSGRMLH